jgi:hypothetical protein
LLGPPFEGCREEIAPLRGGSIMDRDQYIIVDLGTVPTGTLVDDWKNLDRKVKRKI